MGHNANKYGMRETIVLSCFAVLLWLCILYMLINSSFVSAKKKEKEKLKEINKEKKKKKESFLYVTPIGQK